MKDAAIARIHAAGARAPSRCSRQLFPSLRPPNLHPRHRPSQKRHRKPRIQQRQLLALRIAHNKPAMRQALHDVAQLALLFSREGNQQHCLSSPSPSITRALSASVCSRPSIHVPAFESARQSKSIGFCVARTQPHEQPLGLAYATIEAFSTLGCAGSAGTLERYRWTGGSWRSYETIECACLEERPRGTRNPTACPR